MMIKDKILLFLIGVFIAPMLLQGQISKDKQYHLYAGAPTGQGLTDLAALRAYRSPNNDAQYALWTIETN